MWDHANKNFKGVCVELPSGGKRVMMHSWWHDLFIVVENPRDFPFLALILSLQPAKQDGVKDGLIANLWVHFNNSWSSPENLFEPGTLA